MVTVTDNPDWWRETKAPFQKRHGDCDNSKRNEGSYIDMTGVYWDKRKNSPLAIYERENASKGISYAEAQKAETIEMLRKQNRMSKLSE